MILNAVALLPHNLLPGREGATIGNGHHAGLDRSQDSIPKIYL